MGAFDFLKVLISDKKKPKPPKTPRTNNSKIEFDGKSFPLAALTDKGFVATQFDGSLIAGQTARITVKVDDEIGLFTFPATVAINDASNGKCVGEWTLLTPEMVSRLKTYAQRRKEKAKRG